MKKVLVILSLFAFILAMNVSVSSAFAQKAGVEYAKIDKDPTKDGKKTTTDKAKSGCDPKNCTTSKDCSKSCTTTTATTTTKSSCCPSAAKSSCSGEKKTESAQATPDKQ